MKTIYMILLLAIIESGDILLVLSNKKTIEEVKTKIDVNVIPAKNSKT